MKVICTLPNASNEISGVKFADHPDNPEVKVSEDIDEDQALVFASIPGYEIVGGIKKAEQDDAAELDALRARGIAVGLPNAAQMGIKRLRVEVPAAEQAAADKAAADKAAADKAAAEKTAADNGGGNSGQ